jgi:plasmid stabilization system protein ParE
MVFRVETSAEAELDAISILEWLLEQSAGDTGLQWFMGMDKAIASLRNFPERCPLAPENARFPFEVRQLLYGKRPHAYRILFTIRGETVHVLHIRHGRRRHIGEPH